MSKQRKTMNYLTTCIFSIVLTLFVLLSCKSNDNTTQVTSISSSGVSAQPAASSFASIERAAPYYAKGYNLLVGVIDKLTNQYQNAIKDGPGEQQRKPIMMKVFTMDEKAVEDASAIFAEGKKSAPAGNTQLSGPAENAVATARDVIKNYKEAYVYYSAEKYKDDKGSAGIAIHSQMEAAVQNYKSSISALDQQLTIIEQKQLMTDLQLHGDQTTYGHHFRSFNMVATAFIKVDENIAALDKAYGDLEAAYKKIKAFATEKGPSMQQTFSGYMTQVDNFYTHAAVVTRNIKEKIDENKLKNDFDILVSRYNSLVQLTNSLYDLESQGILK